MKLELKVNNGTDEVVSVFHLFQITHVRYLP